MTEKKDQDRLTMKEKSIQVGAIHFAFCITMDEAKKLIRKPKSLVARELRKYVLRVLEEGAKKMIASEQTEDVTDCKVNVEKVFKK